MARATAYLTVLRTLDATGFFVERMPQNSPHRRRRRAARFIEARPRERESTERFFGAP